MATVGRACILENPGEPAVVRDLDTLLLEVDQVGAVCHDRYPTCFCPDLAHG